jgi:putative addiction module killer protein
VQARPRTVHVYETAGTAPFDNWMRQLRDAKGRAAIDARIGLLRRGSLGKFKDVGDGLIELKVGGRGPGYRIYVADDGRKTLILCAGSKPTQKQDIKDAKIYWADSKARRD